MRRGRVKTRSILTVFAAVLVFIFSSSAMADHLDLSPEEVAWLKQHPVVRIGIDANYAPYSFTDSDGKYIGVAPDILALLETKLGIQLKPVAGLSWPEIIEAARNRRIDVIATTVVTDERKAFLDFTQMYIPTPLVIMTRQDDNRIVHPSDMGGKRIALVNGYSSSKQVVREHTGIVEHPVATPLEGLTDVATGKADAYVGVLGVNIYQAVRSGIHNLKVASHYQVEQNGQRLAVRNDWPQLVAILDKALNAIPESEKLAILQKWMPLQDVSTSTMLGRVELSKSEQNFVDAHPVIRVANETDWPPFDFVDSDGNASGYAIDYMDIVASKVGLRIDWVNGHTWQQLIQMGRDREIDVFPVIIRNAERQGYLLFSDAYVE